MNWVITNEWTPPKGSTRSSVIQAEMAIGDFTLEIQIDGRDVVFWNVQEGSWLRRVWLAKGSIPATSNALAEVKAAAERGLRGVILKRQASLASALAVLEGLADEG